MNLVQLPMWLVSGTFFSYERFPVAAHRFIRALPLTALTDALRSVINDGAPLVASWQAIAVMAVVGSGELRTGPETLPLAVAPARLFEGSPLKTQVKS